MGVTSLLLSGQDEANSLFKISNDEKKLINEIMTGKTEIVIYGAKTLGEALAKYFIENGVKIFCFCDKNIAFQKEGLLNLQVLPVEKAVKLGYPIVICSVNYLKEMMNYLKELNFRNFLPFYYFSYGSVIEFADLKKHTWLYEQITIQLDRMKQFQKKKNPLIMNSLGIEITERCTLKCRDCLANNPYIKNPKDASLENQFEALKKIFSAIDYIDVITLSGGEALLHSGLANFINCLITNHGNQFSFIHVITNGTIMLPEDFISICTKQPKVILMISDYGDVSKRKNEIISKAAQCDLLHYIIEYGRILWTKCLPYCYSEEKVNSPEFLREAYNNCEMRCPVLKNGKYYNCACTVHALVQNEIPCIVDDGLNLLLQTTTAEDLRKYISQKYTKICGCCSMRDSSTAIQIPAGIQL